MTTVIIVCFFLEREAVDGLASRLSQFCHVKHVKWFATKPFVLDLQILKQMKSETAAIQLYITNVPTMPMRLISR